MTPADKRARIGFVLQQVQDGDIAIEDGIDRIEAIYAADSTTEISDPYAGIE